MYKFEIFCFKSSAKDFNSSWNFSRIVCIRSYMKYWFLLFLLYTQVAYTQDYVEEVTYKEYNRVGHLVCVNEHSRNYLINAGVPNDAIFFRVKGDKSQWCVIFKDNSAEVLFGGIHFFLNTVLGAVGYEIVEKDGKYLIDETKPIEPLETVKKSLTSNNGLPFNSGMVHYTADKPSEPTVIDAFFKWASELTIWDVDGGLDDLLDIK